MSVFLLIVVIVLLVGPLRRPLLRNARFTVPALLIFLVSFAVIVASATMGGAPSQLAVLFGLPAACLFGAEIKKWCDRIFGPRQQQQQYPRRQQRRE